MNLFRCIAVAVCCSFVVFNHQVVFAKDPVKTAAPQSKAPVQTVVQLTKDRIKPDGVKFGFKVYIDGMQHAIAICDKVLFKNQLASFDKQLALLEVIDKAYLRAMDNFDSALGLKNKRGLDEAVPGKLISDYVDSRLASRRPGLDEKAVDHTARRLLQDGDAYEPYRGLSAQYRKTRQQLLDKWKKRQPCDD
jgi:hypothetical protein